MKKLFMALTIFLTFAASTQDDEIINNLDFFQNMDLVKDEESISLDDEELEDIMKESNLPVEVQDEQS